ncbi:hypothetical protein [Allostreptomyces psammosilenae]|uniref:Uncharacterized protein n=1 Tax=Allostreptomyces psammosilenae TaxID=1892865 RepID=A0A853A0T4_9ACTN|nr:hypothetical protein [Allostreptomyces psammosilenae]NYI08223.1 hypothetical protein [Allostreptomyces psammosilenae]
MTDGFYLTAEDITKLSRQILDCAQTDSRPGESGHDREPGRNPAEDGAVDSPDGATRITRWRNESDLPAYVYSTARPQESLTIPSREDGGGRERPMWLPWRGQGHLEIVTKMRTYDVWDDRETRRITYKFRPEGWERGRALLDRTSGEYTLTVQPDGSVQASPN